MEAHSGEAEDDGAVSQRPPADSTVSPPSWSTMESFVNKTMFSSPISFSSIWSPSAPTTGNWSKDSVWGQVTESSRGGWAAVLPTNPKTTEKSSESTDATTEPDSTASLLESMTQMGLETKRPFLPSCLDSPKNALTMWYGQRFKNFLQFKTNECFTTWDDGGKPHEVKFTSIFTCPVSGEHFASGKYGKERDVYIVLKDEVANVDVYWFCTYIVETLSYCLLHVLKL